MKATWLGMAAAAALLISGQAGAAVDAATAQALATKSGCMACHGVDKKIVGPAYKDVAAKYKGDKSAEAKLIAKVKAGGKGVWAKELGAEIPMPPNAAVKDEDIKTLVQWVLSIK